MRLSIKDPGHPNPMQGDYVNLSNTKPNTNPKPNPNHNPNPNPNPNRKIT